MSTNNSNTQIRTGDVLYVRVSTEAVKPEGAKAHPAWTAEGEASGHYHRVNGGDVVTVDKAMFVVVPDEATLTHEDHDTVTLTAGVWRVYRQREFDPFSRDALHNTRVVMD